MLCLSLPFFIVALIMDLFGLINITASVVWIAKVLFFIFFGLFFLALIIGGSSSKKMKS